MAYAEQTKMPVGRTKEAIEAEIRKRKGLAFGIMQEENRTMVIFVLADRRIRFALHFDVKATDQKIRARWRALLLVIKAKLVSVDAGIETLEEAFLANVVLPDGATVGKRTRPAISDMYASGTMQKLLPSPRSSDGGGR